jgi:hypothetical protein
MGPYMIDGYARLRVEGRAEVGQIVHRHGQAWRVVSVVVVVDDGAFSLVNAEPV